MKDVYVVYSMEERSYGELQDSVEHHGCFSSELLADAFIAKKRKERDAAMQVNHTLWYVSRLPEGQRWSDQQCDDYVATMSSFIGDHVDSLLKNYTLYPKLTGYEVKKVKMEE